MTAFPLTPWRPSGCFIQPWALFTRNLSAHVMFGGFVIAAVYGMTDEFHQTLVPSRSGDAYDVLANVVGSSQGAVLWYAYQYFRQRRKGETRERPQEEGLAGL